MSSHHFVKEGQEPALLVVDALADEHLLSLLEWSPMVLVSAQAAEKVATWGVRVDAVFAEDPAHNESVVLEAIVHAGPAQVIEIVNGLPNAVLSYLRSKQQFALQVMIASPEEHFHSWQFPSDFQVTLLDAHVKWSWIASGRFEKWFPSGTSIQVRGRDEWDVSGAVRAGNQISIERSGIATLSSRESLWVGESLQ